MLRLSYNLDSSSDQAIVFDPTNGRATNINVWDGGSNASAMPTMDRADKTFDAATINPRFARGDIAGSMSAEVSPIVPDAELNGFEIQRPEPNEPVVLTGSFDPADTFIHDVEIEARTDGTVAQFFDPADFDAAFGVARDALGVADLPPDAPVLDEFVIRGIADNTPPIISASSIQSSGGGVLFRYTTPTRSGQIVVAPGTFPEASGNTGRYRPDGFAFDAVSPQVFDRVRDDAMKRGSIPRIRPRRSGHRGVGPAVHRRAASRHPRRDGTGRRIEGHVHPRRTVHQGRALLISATSGWCARRLCLTSGHGG